jgi:hypothetical protein
MLFQLLKANVRQQLLLATRGLYQLQHILVCTEFSMFSAAVAVRQWPWWRIRPPFRFFVPALASGWFIRPPIFWCWVQAIISYGDLSASPTTRVDVWNARAKCAPSRLDTEMKMTMDVCGVHKTIGSGNLKSKNTYHWLSLSSYSYKNFEN